MPMTSGCIASSAVSAAPISRADEHAARRLDRDLHHDRDGSTPARAIARAGTRSIAALRLQQVVDGLDEQHVDAAREQPVDLRLVAVAQRRR